MSIDTPWVTSPDWEGPWPTEPFGTLVPWPDGDLFKTIQHATGDYRAFFVEFDESQYDGDGMGPYYKAEVWEIYLERADD